MSSVQVHERRLMFASRPSVFGLMQAARVLGPIRRVPKLGWVVNDPRLARAVLGDSGHFTVFEEGGAGHMWSQVLGDHMAQAFTDAGHAEFRRRTGDLFTQDSSRAIIERTFSQPADRMVERLLAGEQVDLAQVTRVMVGRMAADLVGVDLTSDPRYAARPGQDPDTAYLNIFEAVRELTSLALRTLMSTQGEPELIARAKVILAQLTTGMESAFMEAPPSSVLGRYREAGLSFEESRSLASLLLVAATETGATAMSRAAALLHDSGQMTRLFGEPGPDLIASAVREVLRVSSPAPVVGRAVSGDVVLGGRQLREGERVLMLLYAMNNAAGAFDVDRPYIAQNRQLWFGGGRHLCLGAPLARAEISFFLLTLARLQRPWRVVSRGYGRRVITPAYSRLVVELT